MATLAPSSRLRGRTVELRTLAEALGRAAGGRPAIVVVEGEAGIGKSRLLAEALEAARSRGLEVVAGRGPLVLGLDDLQWADPSSLLTLGALARRLTVGPVALEAFDAAGAHRLALGQLDPEAVAELVAEGGRPHHRRAGRGGRDDPAAESTLDDPAPAQLPSRADPGGVAARLHPRVELLAGRAVGHHRPVGPGAVVGAGRGHPGQGPGG